MKKLTDQDPQTKSPDLTAENIEQLKTLFPEAVTEGKIDFEVLKQLLGAAVDEQFATAEVEPLALGIVAWHNELAPAGDSQVVFRDGAFVDDVAKTNLTAILH